jgi:hypothetical protein
MTDWNSALEEFDEREIDYIFARSDTNSDNAALEKTGLSYGWIRKRDKDKLNELARQLRIDTSFRAKRILKDAVEEAAKIKTGALKHRDERIRQAAATEILDRELGKPTQRQEVSGVDIQTINVVIKQRPDGS